jgi:transcriptional regulator with XRE-family HTH domain
MDTPVTDVEEGFGARMRRLRAEKGISQSDLAAALDVSSAAVCGWELDRTRPRMQRMHRPADLLGVSTGALLGLEPLEFHGKFEQSRRDIAHIAGTTPDKVRIFIEL